MSISEKLELLVSMDPSKAVAGFKEIGEKAEAAGAKAESSMSKIGQTATKVGIAGLGVGAMLTDLGSKEQASSQQMEASISAVGQSYEEFKGRIDAAVSSQEKYGHSAVDTQDAVSKLTMAYGDTGKALDQMQLVADLAAAKHMSLAEAANVVAKAHGGAGRVFKEFGIQVKTNADGTKDYDGALAELSGKLQGQASAASDTFMGHLKALGTHVEDQVAQIGEKYGPALMMVSSAMSVGGAAAQGLTGILGKLRAARIADTEAAEAEAVASSGIGAALGGVAVALGIAATAYEGYQNAEKLSVDLKGYDKASTADLIRAYDESNRSLGGVNAAQGMFAQLADTNIGTATRLRDALKAQGQDTSALDKILQEASDRQRRVNEDQRDGRDTINDMIEATHKAADAIKAHTQALKDLDDEMRAEIDPLFKVIKAQQDNTTAQTAAEDATRKYGAASQEAKDANLKAADSALSLQLASLALKSAIDSGHLSLEGAKAELDQWVASGTISQATADQLAGSFDSAAFQAGVLANNVSAAAYQLGLMGSAALGAAAGVASIPALPGGGRASGIPAFDTGGMVPGGRGAPMHAVVHGGEYVMTAAMVDAIKAGKGMQSGFGSGVASGGGHITVEVNLNGGVLLATDKRQMDAIGEKFADGVRRALLKTSARNPSGVVGLT